MTTKHRLRTSQNLADAVWVKSSYSGNGTNCVEVADLTECSHGGVAIRDSKALENPVLLVAPSHWSSFVAAVKGGDFPATY